MCDMAGRDQKLRVRGVGCIEYRTMFDIACLVSSSSSDRTVASFSLSSPAFFCIGAQSLRFGRTMLNVNESDANLKENNI